jgi:predicted AAA+ superfamily ATPase
MIEELFDLSQRFIENYDREYHRYFLQTYPLENRFSIIIASGSSAMEIHRGSHDLSRRAIVYHMHGMSFREFKTKDLFRIALEQSIHATVESDLAAVFLLSRSIQ